MGENGLKIILGTQTCLHKLQTNIQTVKTVLSDILGMKTGLHELYNTYTWVKNALEIIPGTEVWFHELQWTSNAVKMTSSGLLDTKAIDNIPSPGLETAHVMLYV